MRELACQLCSERSESSSRISHYTTSSFNHGKKQVAVVGWFTFHRPTLQEYKYSVDVIASGSERGAMCVFLSRVCVNCGCADFRPRERPFCNSKHLLYSTARVI